MSTIEELRIQNEALERSPEYQRIIPEVMKEVYTQFVNERIKQEEKWLEMDDSDDPFYDGSGESMKVSISKRIAEAKRLLPSNPEQAAELFMQLGCCHTLWALQKCILKEKYDITWYTPAELHPEIKYD
ncbi:hypothetical protein [Prevotella sp. P5-50]|uniref:hypothetical protein n=1 Tax=Prevotella sp. P5-50 TaxID=2024217 RepID=UPI000B968C14|nr:hypothetical protein [Prevotella sp. P5-50]OYP39782.1 hypothetical protein CIK88_10815 [Prevotella sp. P5-50]